MEPQKYKVLNGEELTKIIKNQLPTDANKMKNLSSDDIEEIKSTCECGERKSESA